MNMLALKALSESLVCNFREDGTCRDGSVWTDYRPLRALPVEFDMEDIVTRHECHTTCCAYGLALIDPLVRRHLDKDLAHDALQRVLNPTDSSTPFFDDVLALFSIDHDEAVAIFSPCGYRDLDTEICDITPVEVARKIDRLLHAERMAMLLGGR